MSKVTYEIVEHDGGWAYKLGDVFSETFPNRHDAELAAAQVASEHARPGDNEHIEFEDEKGVWHEEDAAGSDRPDVSVHKPD